MVRENDRWNGALDSLQLLQEAFWYGSDVFRLELVKAWRAVTDYISPNCRRSQQQMTEDFIDVYGNYAIKLLRLQNDMIQTFDRYRRGNKQTVEVRHVHIHSGGQGVVGIINPPDDRDAGVRE
jgi:hypothetical protein